MNDKATESSRCAVCGGPVNKEWRGRPARYCSTECRRSAAEMRRKAAATQRTPKGPTRCAECGGTMQQAGIGRPKRFCSDKCKRRAGNRRVRRSQKPLRESREAVCPYCERPFIAKRVDRIYCYDGYCAQMAYRARLDAGKVGKDIPHVATCDECGTEFDTVKGNARWCSKQCANRHWGRVRSRRRTELSPIPYTDLEIFERDKWRCHLCGKKVDPKVDRKAPDGATIDHLLPIALGGRDEPANVACAHNKCNRDKRTRAMNEQLAII